MDIGIGIDLFRRFPINMTREISLIIPVLNEEKTIRKTLQSVKNQKLRPKQIVIVDAGSEDNTINEINNWLEENKWKDLNLLIIKKPGAFPGTGRNVGVTKAKYENIAFLDSGIEADVNWLHKLSNYKKHNNCEGVFGVCKFSGKSSFQNAVAALSYGQNSVHVVLPASIFNKKIFQKVGFFSSNLKFFEDLIWIDNYIKHKKIQNVCWEAKVNYEYFPTKLIQVIKKWEMAGFYLSKSRYNNRLVYSVLLFIIIFVITSTLYPKFLLFMLPTYFFLRVILDTGRRSNSWLWWKNDIKSLFYAMLIAPTMDLSKIFGIFRFIIINKIKTENFK